MHVLRRSDGTPFAAKTKATYALRHAGLEATHEVAEVPGADGGAGFEVRPKAKSEQGAPMPHSQTREEIVQRQDERAQAGAADQRARAQAEARDAAELERLDVAQRSEGAAADFEMGQSAEQNLSGQKLLFSRSGGGNVLYRAPEVRDAQGRLLAPNGKPSKLTERQWHAVRSPQFKAWFGDWELPLRRIEPVALTLKGWSGSAADLKALATKWYSEHLQGRSFPNDDMGVQVLFSAEGRGTAFATSGNTRTPWKAEMVQVLPELIKRAVKVDEQAPDARRAATSRAFHTLLAPLAVNGRVVTAKITLRESLHDLPGKHHKFYDMTALEIENGPVMFGAVPGGSAGPLHPTGTEPSSITVGELARAVKGMDLLAGVSKVVDNNGEPMVVYHGTNADFDSFDPNRSNAAQYGGRGFFFTGNERVARLFGDHVMPVFLNAKTGLPEKRAARAQGRTVDVDHIRPKNDERDIWVVFAPNQIKSATGNSGAFSAKSDDIRFSRSRPLTPEQRKENFEAWRDGAEVVTSAQADAHVFKSGEPVLVEAFHGTARPDRVGDVFDPKRATSGPMAFFTSAPELASDYAKNKGDTSLHAEDQAFANWFKVRVDGQKQPVAVDRAWYSLTPEQQRTVAERLPDIRLDDDASLPIYEKGGGDLGNYDWELQKTQKGHDRRGNPLKAAVESWLSSGSIFGEEHLFMDVLRLAGMPMDRVEYDSPNASFPAVYKTHIRMGKPLVTSDVPQAVRDALDEAGKRDRSKAKPFGADMWDKNRRTLREWVAEFNKSGGADSLVWTSIPDKVTAVFKALGYDGIIDLSNKGGGGPAAHPVYIPFASTQVKSATGNRGAFDDSKKSILASRSATAAPTHGFLDGEPYSPPTNALTPDQRRAVLDAYNAHADAQVTLLGPVEDSADITAKSHALQAVRSAITEAYGDLLVRLEARGLVQVAPTLNEALTAAAKARADQRGTDAQAERAGLLAQAKRSAAARRLWSGVRTVNDYLLPETPAYEGNMTGDLAHVPARGGLKAGPVRVAVGIARDLHRGFGLMHLADNARRDGRRAPEAHTGELAEDLIRETVSALGGRVSIHHDGVSHVLVNQADGKAVVMQWRGDHYSVISVRPFKGNPQNLWGRPVWGGRLTFPPRADAVSAPPTAGHHGNEPHRERDGLGVKSEPVHFTADGSLDIKRSADGAVQGFFDPATGRAFLVADAMAPEDAPGVLMHEVGIHMAADGSLAPLFEHALELVNRPGDALAAQVRKRMADAGETSGEEAAAYLVEAYENAPLKAGAPAALRRFIHRLRSRVKAWLHGNGWLGTERLTVADLAAIARANAQRAAGAGRAPGDSALRHSRAGDPAAPSGPGSSGPQEERRVRLDYRRRVKAFISRLDARINGTVGLPDTEQYLAQRYLAMGRIGEINRVAEKVRETFRKASADDKAAVYHYLTTRGAPRDGIADEAVREMAAQVKHYINTIGESLVERGLLRAESRLEYRDRYLPRLYLSHLLSESDWRSVGSGKKASDLSYLKARKDVPEEVRAVLLGEVKDPAFLAATALAKPMRDMALIDWLGQISQNEKWIHPQTLVTWQGRQVSAFWMRAEAAALRKRARHYADAANALRRASRHAVMCCAVSLDSGMWTGSSRSRTMRPRRTRSFACPRCPMDTSAR